MKPARTWACLSLSVVLAGCGASSSPAPIKVAFTQGYFPPGNMVIGTRCEVAATVTNDPRNAGVNWTLACNGSADQCGEFLSAPSTASSIPITYQAPLVIPQGGNINVTAISVSDPSKSASAPIGLSQTISQCQNP